MNYYKKYLKYKNKYLKLQLELKQTGGDKAVILNQDFINLFSKGSDEETFLNPIYGLILCNNGFITNNYYLKEFINNSNNNFDPTVIDINNTICKIVKKESEGLIKPINDIMTVMTPISFGRFIAIKYLHLIGKINITINKNGIIKYDDAISGISNLNSTMNSYINVFKKFIPINDKHHVIYFHIILYCLWWSSYNDEGIKQYYEGIDEVFKMLEFHIKPFVFNYNKTDEPNNTFEKIVFDLTDKFVIFGQEQSKHYCLSSNSKTYPDCGETTARNLINLACFNNNKFDLKLLHDYGAIDPVIEYYKKFDDFVKQSTENARNEWSKLIIENAQYDVVFIENCIETDNWFNVYSGLNKSKTKENFLQLINNLLLNIQGWDNLKNEVILDLKNNTNNGIGNITIHTNKSEIFTMHLLKKHYYINQNKKINFDNYNFVNISNEQKTIINQLSNKEEPTNENYIWFNYDSEYLIDLFQKTQNIELKKKLFKLSFTTKYNYDIRSQIIIDVNDLDLFNYILNLEYTIKKNIIKCIDDNTINEYIYESNDFSFLTQIPKLINLNSIINNKELTNINISPLLNIISIENFMYNCYELETINLTELEKLEIIKNAFMYNCNKLKNIILPSNIKVIEQQFMNNCFELITIDLSHLLNLKIIKDDFMNNCKKLTNIVFSLEIKYIGNNFMCNCYELTTINLSLLNIEIIRNSFMNNCIKLTNIKLPINIKSIENKFMLNCSEVVTIDLSTLIHLETIGNYFMCECLKITDVKLPNGIQSIGDNFMLNCSNLTNIIMPNNIQSIGDNFMYNCSKLMTIDLSLLINLKIENYFMCNCFELTYIKLPNNIQSIGDDFMLNCYNLTNIILPNNIDSIGDNFMCNCSELTNVDLSKLENLEIIKDYFMCNCSKLKYIEFPNNIHSIGNNFMCDCSELTNVDLSKLENLEIIKDYFMCNCSNLINIKFPNKIQSIGDNCLEDTNIDLPIELKNLID